MTARLESQGEEWTAPQAYGVRSRDELEQLTRQLGVSRVIDPAEYIADDLFELEHPDQLGNDAARTAFITGIVRQGPAFGQWVHYPHDQSLVHFADRDDHYALRTARNRKLIEAHEQSVLRNKKIAVVGLSVGSNVLDSLVQAGIGDRYLLFDFDRLSPSNLNRIRAGVDQVGLLKTTVAGRKIAELDPYITQDHFSTGYDHTTDDILRAEQPDLIVEEVDDMGVKARLRSLAAQLRVPLVMAGDVGDKSVLHVERHDLGTVKPFNGKLSRPQMAALSRGTMPSKAQENAMIKTLGLRNLSPRLIESAMARGTEVAGLAQLGTTATLGGALTTVAVRDILLGRRVPSGIHVVDARQSVGASRPTTLRQDYRTIRRFMRYRNAE
jgi:tRNA threonylcarbamoyladenosine dehydratase